MDNSEQPNPHQETDEDEKHRDDIQDFADIRFQKLEKQILERGRNSDKTPLSIEAARDLALNLHRWIEGTVIERTFDSKLTKSFITYLYGQDVKRETLDLQKKAVQDIINASKLLQKRINAALQLTDLGNTLEQAYNQIKESAIDNPDDLTFAKAKYLMSRTKYPSWLIMRDVATAITGAWEEIANKANDNLTSKKAPMGQPRKLDRDRSFHKWHNLLAADLNIPRDESTHLACTTWEIYFPEEPISEESAIKILKNQHKKSKESSASNS